MEDIVKVSGDSTVNQKSKNTDTIFWNVNSPKTISIFEKISSPHVTGLANSLLLWKKNGNENWSFTLKRVSNLKGKVDERRLAWKRTWTYDPSSIKFIFNPSIDENDNFTMEDDITDKDCVRQLITLADVFMEKKGSIKKD